MKCTATTALYLHILRTAEQHHREILSTLADLAQTTRKEIVERKVAFREAQERAEGVEDLKKKKKKKDHKKSRAASPSDNPCKRAKGAAATTAATATAAAATTPPATATTVTAAATGKSPRPAYCFQHLAPQLTADKLSNLFTTLRNHKKHSQHPMLSILRQHGVGIPDPPKWMTATMAYKLLNLASKEFTPLLQRDLKNKARAAQRQLKKVAEHHDEGARFACEHTAELALYIGAAQHLARTLAPPDTDLTSLKIFPTFTNKHPFIQLDAGLLRDLTCFKCGRLGHSQRQCRQPAAVRPPPRQALSLLDFLGADVARQFRKRRVTSIRTDGYTAYLLVEPSARRDTVCDTSPITPVVGVDPGTRIPLACVRIQDGKKMMVSQKRIGGGAEPGSVDDVVASARECLREGVSRRELKWRLHEKLKHCRFRSRVAGELATRFGRDCRVFFGDW
ncbi:hypothetical protein PTSG_04012 [Salpingoeca rosetta]|uniref:CCHC-type domain-containing protein n=1 Tax=Salpingoeca rosetta (strain ATCC 50818 / BSB-021) TaxID=946362 RepID=F2U7I7_SALR5|nr:uncharacterized protein PTSG_04012 [Salpingoeca rosetta]EGD83404.1 hypothetical protein PTSG_04012 [Salpingoeca rosetta]|eukprot:XP_004994908.1 hypothetical protein PTSG_04012 [Salpingoeca rosetta]